MRREVFRGEVNLWIFVGKFWKDGGEVFFFKFLFMCEVERRGCFLFGFGYWVLLGVECGVREWIFFLCKVNIFLGFFVFFLVSFVSIGF